VSKFGVNIVKHALQDPHSGFNALTGEFGDLVTGGVLDPSKVVRAALTNAGSIASLVLTTQPLVADLPEEGKGAKVQGGPLNSVSPSTILYFLVAATFGR
jgi:chaperonin GroEL (HSP60 family)